MVTDTYEPDDPRVAAGQYEYCSRECKTHGEQVTFFRPYKANKPIRCLECYVTERGPLAKEQAP